MIPPSGTSLDQPGKEADLLSPQIACKAVKRSLSAVLNCAGIWTFSSRSIRCMQQRDEYQGFDERVILHALPPRLLLWNEHTDNETSWRRKYKAVWEFKGGGEEMNSTEDRRRELGRSEHGKCWGKGAVCRRPGSVWASEALFIHMCLLQSIFYINNHINTY